jgi:hypothetical protein
VRHAARDSEQGEIAVNVKQSLSVRKAGRRLDARGPLARVVNVAGENNSGWQCGTALFTFCLMRFRRSAKDDRQADSLAACPALPIVELWLLCPTLL